MNEMEGDMRGMKARMEKNRVGHVEVNLEEEHEVYRQVGYGV